MDWQHYQVGGVLSVPERFYRHLGIYLGNGQVIHASQKQRRVVIDSIDRFAKGRPVSQAGYPGRLPPQDVVRRACELRGRRYDLLRDNCEHLVAHAHGLPKQSPQLRRWLATGALVVIAAVAARRVRIV